MLDDRIKEIISEDIEKEGFEIFEIKSSQFKGRTIIRIFIDKPGGVTTDDCGKVSDIAGFLLDNSDLNIARYDLEVSSPGLDRPLASEKDFKKNIGMVAVINLKETVEGKIFYEGKIISTGNDIVEVSVKDKNIKIPISKIHKAKLRIEI
ncbi:MAG: hypothetical protein A2539_07830 [Elusimicrobia bacterium RIFOXYD2_FULL_34_15]|nr:MAG: hypothetical protein A2539_07830 [Elusimicrobia bacterium RIFOXYD2_FULL_34_15]